jgi:type VI protein secretion system component VasK
MSTAISIIGTVVAVITLWLAWRWNRQSKQEINRIRDETVAARVVLNNRLDQGVAVKFEAPQASGAALPSSARKALSQDRTCAGSG